MVRERSQAQRVPQSSLLPALRPRARGVGLGAAPHPAQPPPQVGSARSRRTAAPGATRRPGGWRRRRRSRTLQEPVTAGGTGRRGRAPPAPTVGLARVWGWFLVWRSWRMGAGRGDMGLEGAQGKSAGPWRAPKFKAFFAVG